MIDVLVKGIAGAAEVYGWLTYEQRKWWREEGNQAYPNIAIVNDNKYFLPDFLLVWNWTGDEVYIGVKDTAWSFSDTCCLGPCSDVA